VYARPLADGAPLRFGVSGKLWRQALVLFDRQTGSLWSQREHRAIAGALAGQPLDLLPSEITTWGAWRTRHPGTLVLAPADGPRLVSARQRLVLAAALAILLGWALTRLAGRRGGAF